eukprot:TRINITY_DN7614_c0_g1_i1.p2 TRINITY_DN7614_c0_g1~~TRINITY_DN7614_c0_g1_i1.p2  ORF type:complete len:120 (-),score=33.14 TRINITY_DN7614_c0_g1_i1:152-511(-)
MNSFAEEFEKVANFVYVYIKEAHAQDVWPMGKHEVIQNHKTLEDRIKAAKRLRDHYGATIPIFVDKMDDMFEQSYFVWPERYFIINNMEISVVGVPSSEYGFDRDQIKDYLKNLCETDE